MNARRHMRPRPETTCPTRGAEKAAVQRWLNGQVMAAARSRRLATDEGPDPAKAVAEALSAVNALATMGLWPGRRDPASEAAVTEVRCRWAKIQRRARHARER